MTTGRTIRTHLKLLDVLAKHDVRATFFMIGRYVQQRPDIARAVAQAGHVIGNHTFTHPLLIFESAAQDADATCRLPNRLWRTRSASIRICFVRRLEDRRPATLRIARELGLRDSHVERDRL